MHKYEGVAVKNLKREIFFREQAFTALFAKILLLEIKPI